MNGRRVSDWAQPHRAHSVEGAAGAASAQRPRRGTDRGTGRGEPARRSWRRRSAVIAGVVAVVCGVAGVVMASAQPGRGGGTPGAPIPLGIVRSSDPYFASEKAAGLELVMIGASWNKAEPSAGVFDDAYLASLAAEVAAARSRSLGVVLDPGLQYPPDWVFDLPGGTRFVDQYGDVYHGQARLGRDVANAVTDPAVRTAESRYLKALSAHVPGSLLSAVRTGGGPENELSYPTGNYNGHRDSFWAYDSSSQAVSPVPGWTPGTGTTAEASKFLAAYNHNLNAYGAWLVAQTAADFHARQLVMLPGWGERPGVAHKEISALLTLGYQEFSQGLDWADLLPSLPDRTRLVAYSTYLDAPATEQTPQHTDPMSYIASIAAPLHLALGGENTGHGTVGNLDLVVRRAISLRLSLVEWIDQKQVVASGQGRDPAGPTFTDLAHAARTLSA